MARWFASMLALTALLTASPAWGQDEPPEPEKAAEAAPESCEGGTCVADEDLKKFVDLARDRKCLDSTKPEFELDPVTIVIDKEGRVFFSGAEPHPYTVKMTWCGYDVEAQGKVDVVAAMNPPAIWGFRFRPKAYIGVLPLEALYVATENAARELAGEETESLGVGDVWDAGVMADFFFYDWFNLNVAAGFRSFGGGLGADLTENFGAYLGYANTWGTWHHNVNAGFSFSFYNPD